MNRCALVTEKGFVKYLNLEGEPFRVVLPVLPGVDLVFTDDSPGDFAPSIYTEDYIFRREYTNEFGETTRIYERIVG